MPSISSRPGRRQPHRLPPPITHAPEALEGGTVLEETPGVLGCVLWKSVRAVEMWSALDAGDRRMAFRAEAYGARIEQVRGREVPAALVEPLVAAAGVLREEAKAEELAGACRRVAEWAEGEGRIGTALAFMQAGALATPGMAELAYETGRLAQAARQPGRAETWVRQAISVGRRQGDWHTYERGHVGLADLLAGRGSLPAARRSLMRALRSAARRGHREAQAWARHELAVHALAAGRRREALGHARAALGGYGAGHRRLAALAGDLAYHWLTRQGYHVVAAEILESLRARRSATGEAIEAGGSLAAEGRAAALLALARGAALPGEWVRGAWICGEPSPEPRAAPALVTRFVGELRRSLAPAG